MCLIINYFVSYVKSIFLFCRVGNKELLGIFYQDGDVMVFLRYYDNLFMEYFLFSGCKYEVIFRSCFQLLFLVMFFWFCIDFLDIIFYLLVFGYFQLLEEFNLTL